MLERVEQWARGELEQKNAARERALADSRELVRQCATSIRAVHRGEFERAAELRENARRLSEQLTRDLAVHPDLYHAGYVQDAQKEYVEAATTYALVAGESLPGPEQLGVAVAAFLNGLAESVGELRRYILDQLRQGRLERSEEILRTMDEIYGLLVTMDYPDALSGGLRRSTDSVRGIMEKTRGDQTFALRQRDLERALARFESRVSGGEARPSP
jgi:translin